MLNCMRELSLKDYRHLNLSKITSIEMQIEILSLDLQISELISREAKPKQKSTGSMLMLKMRKLEEKSSRLGFTLEHYHHLNMLNI